jgi:hypothetical protein
MDGDAIVVDLLAAGDGEDDGAVDWERPRSDFLQVVNEGSEAKPPVDSDQGGAAWNGGAPANYGRWRWGFFPLSFACRKGKKEWDGGDVCEEERQLEMPWSRDKAREEQVRAGCGGEGGPVHVARVIALDGEDDNRRLGLPPNRCVGCQRERSGLEGKGAGPKREEGDGPSGKRERERG